MLTHPGVLQSLQVGGDVETDSVHIAWQCDPADEKDYQHDVGEGRRKVHNLP